MVKEKIKEEKFSGFNIGLKSQLSSVTVFCRALEEMGFTNEQVIRKMSNHSFDFGSVRGSLNNNQTESFMEVIKMAFSMGLYWGNKHSSDIVIEVFEDQKKETKPESYFG